MKKMLSIAVLAIILLVAMASCVSATTKAGLLDAIYSIGAKYGMTSGDKVRLERDIKDFDITDEQADALVAKAEAIAAILDAEGVTNYDKLTTAKKDEVKAILVEAAKIIDATLVFKTKSVEIYKNGKLIDIVTNNAGRLSYTGNEVNVALIAGITSVIALASAVVVKKTVLAK